MRDPNRLRPIEAQWRAGEQDAALLALADHLARDPEDGTAWSLRGLYLLDKKRSDPALAVEALDRSLAIAPTYPAAYNAGNAGVFDYVPGPLRTGTFEGDLVDLLEAAMRRFPENPAFAEYWAGIREFRGEPGR